MSSGVSCMWGKRRLSVPENSHYQKEQIYTRQQQTQNKNKKDAHPNKRKRKKKKSKCRNTLIMLSLRGHRYLGAVITTNSKFIQDNTKYKTKNKKDAHPHKRKRKRKRNRNVGIHL